MFEGQGNINTKLVPISAIQDVDKRISDWLAAGGKETDPYVQKQIHYLKQLEKIAIEERKG